MTVEFEPTTYTVDEPDCYANITVVKRGQTTQTVSVSFTTADGNATGDYVKTAEYRASLYVTPWRLLLVSARLAVLKFLTLTIAIQRCRQGMQI